MASTESKIPVGQILVGKYRVVREIGRGGMAAVYEAEQLSLGKKVAVKVLAAELSASTIVIERFFREARAAASVKSPYIVDVYDSGRLDDGRPFIAMELLEGESLYDRMARVRIIDIETTIRVIVHTARGLVKAHAAGIVHRDLKPENIFLTHGEDGDDVCKILDFGLAKFYAPVNPEEKSQKRLTREGAVFGTPAYMSPEQVKGQGTVDHRADLWALGCMAFECLIGRPVWNMDQGVAMTFAAIATGPIPVPSQIRSDLPPAFDAWFKKCLERDPNRRYQSAKELADAFVEAWGQDRLKTSSASFPSFALTGGSRALQAGGYEAQEMGGDVLESVRPAPGAPPVPGRGAPPINGAGLFDPSSTAVPIHGRLASTDVPPTSDPDTPLPRRKPSPVRLAISGAFLAGSLSLMIFVWFRFLGPQVLAPVVQSTATAPPSAIPSGTPPPAPTDLPKWLPIISEGQRRFTQNDVKGAQEKFQEAMALGPPASIIGKVFSDQIKLTTIAKETKGRCKPVAFARPRLSFDRRAERPAIVTTSKGYLVTWTDDHEQKDKDHVYGVLLDPTGKSLGAIRDLTPEASDAQRPQLVPQSADRTVLLWWDAKGREAGVRVRLLDADGRIDPSKGNAVLVGAARPGDYWPSIEKGPNGFFVVWQDDRDKEKEYDLFVRRLTPDLDTFGPETRLTDYYAPPKSKTPPPRIRYPSAVVAANTLLVAYRLERERDREVWRLKVGLDELDRGGLPESKENPRDSRVLGDAVRISDERLPADAPDIACSNEGCFVVWHGEPNGVWVAGIDPNGGLVQWHKKIAEKGGHPSIAVNGNQVAVAYYEGSKEKEGGRLKMAFLSRDGVATPSTIFRVHDEKAPRPSLAPGVDPNEWVLAWQDSDAPKGSAEIFAARVLCR